MLEDENIFWQMLVDAGLWSSVQPQLVTHPPSPTFDMSQLESGTTPSRPMTSRAVSQSFLDEQTAPPRKRAGCRRSILSSATVWTTVGWVGAKVLESLGHLDSQISVAGAGREVGGGRMRSCGAEVGRLLGLSVQGQQGGQRGAVKHLIRETGQVQ